MEIKLTLDRVKIVNSTSSLIGKIIKSYSGYEYIVLGKVKTLENKRAYWLIEFLDNKVQLVISDSHIRKNIIKNPYAKNKYGASKGRLSKNHWMYNRWNGMIRRCYDKKFSRYKDYGAKGILVCDRWLCFEQYVYDVISMKNFDIKKSISKEIVLDKDINSGDIKIYSPETCEWISQSENAKQRWKENKIKKGDVK